MKNVICTGIGMVGSLIAMVFGGWSTSLTTLLILMAIDYVSGIVTAAIFHASPKTKNGTLESRAGWKGLVRKGMILLLVLIGYRLDIVIGTTYIKDAVCIAFMANELISIVENAGLMGLPIPAVIENAIEILTKKNESE